MLEKKAIYSFLQYISLLDMKSRDYRVLHYILPKINTDEFVKVNQKYIAEEMNLSKSEVSKAVKRLLQEGIILENKELENKRKKVELKLADFTKETLDDWINEKVEVNTLMYDF